MTDPHKGALYHETHTIDESNEVAFNLMEDIRCLKEELAAIRAENLPNTFCNNPDPIECFQKQLEGIN